MALVFGFGGLRDRGQDPSFRPQLPERLTRLGFSLFVRGTRLHVDIDADGAHYSVVDGPALAIRHGDERITVVPGTIVHRPLITPPPAAGSTPAIPSGPGVTRPPPAS